MQSRHIEPSDLIDRAYHKIYEERMCVIEKNRYAARL